MRNIFSIQINSSVRLITTYSHVQFPSDQSTNQSLALNIRAWSVSGVFHKYLTGLFDGRLLCKHAEIDFEAYRTRTATPAWFHDGIL